MTFNLVFDKQINYKDYKYDRKITKYLIKSFKIYKILTALATATMANRITCNKRTSFRTTELFLFNYNEKKWI